MHLFVYAQQQLESSTWVNCSIAIIRLRFVMNAERQGLQNKIHEPVLAQPMFILESNMLFGKPILPCGLQIHLKNQNLLINSPVLSTPRWLLTIKVKKKKKKKENRKQWCILGFKVEPRHLIFQMTHGHVVLFWVTRTIEKTIKNMREKKAVEENEGRWGGEVSQWARKKTKVLV